MTGFTLHETPTDDASVYGGKAASLARLRDAGLPVPPFVVLVPGEGKRPWVEILGYIDMKLGKGTFAVRSSALAEDGASHSHAGQFLSMLNVRRPNLRSAAVAVADSVNGDSVREYRRLNGLPEDGGIAVVVQRMVKADCAGVAFTADPVSGRRDWVVVSATEGLADRLVGGEADGHDVVIDKRTGRIVRGGVPFLTDRNREDLLDLLLKVEALHGGVAQDVEWAIEDDVVHLVQSRPVTTALAAMQYVGAEEVLKGDHAETILDNSNIVESYPGMVSPLTYSFASYAYARVYRTFLEIVGVPRAIVRENAAVLDNMLARIDGRVYYNLINWYKALALLPGFERNSRAMETMMGVSEPLPEAWLAKVSATATRDTRWFGMPRTALRFAWRAVRLDSDVKAFRKRMARSLDIPREKIAGMSLSELAAEYRSVEARLLDRWDAPLVNDFLCMMAFAGSRNLLLRWAGEAGLELHNDAMIGQGDIVSAEPARRIAAMGAMVREDRDLVAALAEGGPVDLASRPDLARAVAEYLARFGDRCVQELKLESLTLQEDPRALYGAIAGAARNPHDKREAMPVEDRVHALLAESRVKRFVVKAALAYAKARVRDRENLRFERTLIFGHARRVLRAMGTRLHEAGVLADPRDVFHLTIQEILGFVEGSGVTPLLSELVHLRRTVDDASARRPDPPERILVKGAVQLGVLSAPPPMVEGPVDDPMTVTATGCCSGVVEGFARVIRDPATENLQPGEIMVARHTDPGWIAVFSNASAIVVERGSLLSHSAIVSRELGIPCVVGVKGATGWIGTGDYVRVDGGSGKVTILERAGA